MKHIYTSIDIGSDTIKIVVCELFNNKLNLLAASSVKSKGIKKGLITDVHEASEAVKEGIMELEQMLGIRITKVIASIPCYSAEYTMIKGQISIEEKVEGITGNEIIQVMQAAMSEKNNPDYEIVTTIPIDFDIDGTGGIKNPKGMIGKSLGIRAIMISTPKKNIYSVVSLLENIGLDVVDISLNGIGDNCAFKSLETDQKVGAIINIGHETTTISLYNKGIIVKSSVIGMGGKNIDNDIAYIYKLDQSTARIVKEKFAFAHKNYASKSDTYEVEDKNGEIVKINQFEVSEIVMSRIEEILVLARKEINILTKREVDYILVSGGTSSMSNFSKIAEDILGKISKVGNVRLIGVRHNKYSAVLGNVVYFIEKLKLRGQYYSMVSKSDMEELSSTRKSLINISNESMLGKVFGYFFSE